MWLGVFQKEGYKTVRELSSCGEKNVSSRETHVQGPEAAGTPGVREGTGGANVARKSEQGHRQA